MSNLTPAFLRVYVKLNTTTQTNHLSIYIVKSLFLTNTFIHCKMRWFYFVLQVYTCQGCTCVRQVIVLFVLKVFSLTSDFSVVHSSGDRYISAHILAPGWENKQEAVQSLGLLCGALEKWCSSKSSYLCTFVPLIIHFLDVFEPACQNQVWSKKHNLH